MGLATAWALAAEDGHAEVARDAREAVDAPRLLTSERDKPYLRSSDRRSGDARRGEGVCIHSCCGLRGQLGRDSEREIKRPYSLIAYQTAPIAYQTACKVLHGGVIGIHGPSHTL